MTLYHTDGYEHFIVVQDKMKNMYLLCSERSNEDATPAPVALLKYKYGPGQWQALENDLKQLEQAVNNGVDPAYWLENKPGNNLYSSGEPNQTWFKRFYKLFNDVPHFVSQFGTDPNSILNDGTFHFFVKDAIIAQKLSQNQSITR